MRALLTVLSVFSLLVACADEATELAESNVAFAGLLSEGCQQGQNGSSNFPPNVERIKLVMSADGQEPFSVQLVPDELKATPGQILVEHVPAGDDWTLDLYGCQGTEVTWSSRTPGVTVEASNKTAPSLYFTRKNDFSCTGAFGAGQFGLQTNPQPAPAFHTTYLNHQGNLVLVGGFVTFVGKQFPELIAALPNNPNIVEYYPDRGLFRAWDGGMKEGRGLHHTVRFDGGRKALVMGGLTRARLHQDPPINRAPSANDPGTPTDPVVVLDSVNRTATPWTKQKFEARPLSAAASSPDGLTILVSGGMDEDSEPSNSLEYVNAASPDQLVDESAVVVRSEKLNFPRMGHTATWFGEGALILGGNFDSAVANIAEVIFDDEFTPVPVVIDGDAGAMPMGFHTTGHVLADGSKHVFLLSGGFALSSSADGVDTADPSFRPNLYRFTLDIKDPAAPVGTFEDLSAVVDNPIRIGRGLHAMTAIGANQFMISGGINQLSQLASPDPLCDPAKKEIGCYLSDTMIIQATGGSASELTFSLVGPDDLRISSSRFGHSSAALANGTVLVTGGVLAIDKSLGDIEERAELFNPVRPAEADICAQ